MNVNKILDMIVAFSKRGRRAASSRRPQYKGKTSISILIMRITFMTPPAWWRRSIIVASHSRPIGPFENGEPFLTYRAPRILRVAYPATVAQNLSTPFQTLSSGFSGVARFATSRLITQESGRAKKLSRLETRCHAPCSKPTKKLQVPIKDKV